MRIRSLLTGVGIAALLAIGGVSEAYAKGISGPAGTPPTAMERPIFLAMQVTVPTGHKKQRGYSPTTRRVLPTGEEGGGGGGGAGAGGGGGGGGGGGAAAGGGSGGAYASATMPRAVGAP